MNKLVSIILPTKNMEKYIKKCIDSIIQSTFDDYEIIVSDFGSEDSTIKIVEQYQKENVPIRVVHDIGGNPATSRNLGMKEAKGKYLMFIDSDDWINPQMIEILYNKMEEYDLDIINCGYYNVINGKNEIVHTYEDWRIDITTENLNDVLAEIATGKLNFEVWTKMYRREFIERSGAYFDDENGIHGEDVFFSMLVWFNEPKMMNIEERLYYHLIRTQSVTHSSQKDLTDRFITIINKLYSKSIEQKKDVREGLSQLFVSLIIQDLTERNSVLTNQEKIVKYTENKEFLNLFNVCAKSTYSTLKRKVLCVLLRFKCKYLITLIIGT
uniref:glycosyltransferase n=1 Tax=Agathobacter sp. TaxID=2021311 RepID=UPI0040573F7B